MPGIGHWERQITALIALEVEKGAHQSKGTGGLVAVDIRAKARHDAHVEAFLDRRSTVTHLHLNGDRDRDVPTLIRERFPRGDIAGVGKPSVVGTHLSFWSSAPSHAVNLSIFGTNFGVAH